MAISPAKEEVNKITLNNPKINPAIPNPIDFPFLSNFSFPWSIQEPIQIPKTISVAIGNISRIKIMPFGQSSNYTNRLLIHQIPYLEGDYSNNLG